MSQPGAKPNGLKCEVCGKPLTGKQRRACGKEHGQQLRGRASADRANMARTVAENLVTASVQAELDKQVGPVVREALTENILGSIRSMVFLMPQAIEALHNNLINGDVDQKQKAATTLLRYTMGNPSVAPPSLEASPAPLQVLFNVPLSGSLPAAPDDLIEGAEPDEAAELKECMECHQHKPLSAFVGRSDRCKDCHARLMERVEDEYGRVDLG